jgi:hypothetical protein
VPDDRQRRSSDPRVAETPRYFRAAGFGIADRSKEDDHSAGGDRREELGEVHAEHDVATGVLAGVREDRASGAEAVRGIVRWDMVEDRLGNLSLRDLQPALRCFDQTR